MPNLDIFESASVSRETLKTGAILSDRIRLSREDYP
jgi:hypothetical protein